MFFSYFEEKMEKIKKYMFIILIYENAFSQQKKSGKKSKDSKNKKRAFDYSKRLALNLASG